MSQIHSFEEALKAVPRCLKSYTKGAQSIEDLRTMVQTEIELYSNKETRAKSHLTKRHHFRSAQRFLIKTRDAAQM